MNATTPLIGFFLCIALLFSISCKKEYVEIVPVVTVKQIQLPTQETIKILDFPSATVGFAGTGTGGEMYRTIDGGTTWTTIDLPSTNYHHIAFSTVDTGSVLMNNGLYRTTNGGSTWTFIQSAVFVGRLSNGMYILADFPSNPFSVHVKRSTNTGSTYQSIGATYEWKGRARVCGDHLYLFGENSGIRIDPSTGGSTLFGYQPEVYQGTKDLYFEGTCGVLVGDDGDIQDGCVGSYFIRQNPWSRWDMRAVDGYPGSPRFAVGENSISSNQDIGTEENWNVVFNEQGEGIRGSFHSIKCPAPGRIIVGGTNGTILNCTY